MATVVWSGSGYPITSLASIDAADVLTVTWNTLVSSDSRGRSGATSAYGNTPIQDDTLTLSHTLYFTAVDGDYSFVEVQSGDGAVVPFSGGTIDVGVVGWDTATFTSVADATGPNGIAYQWERREMTVDPLDGGIIDIGSIGWDTATFTSVEDASGGSEDFEYQWERRILTADEWRSRNRGDEISLKRVRDGWESVQALNAKVSKPDAQTASRVEISVKQPAPVAGPTVRTVPAPSPFAPARGPLRLTPQHRPGYKR